MPTGRRAAAPGARRSWHETCLTVHEPCRSRARLARRGAGVRLAAQSPRLARPMLVSTNLRHSDRFSTGLAQTVPTQSAACRGFRLARRMHPYTRGRGHRAGGSAGKRRGKRPGPAGWPANRHATRGRAPSVIRGGVRIARMGHPDGARCMHYPMAYTLATASPCRPHGAAGMGGPMPDTQRTQRSTRHD